ncbi:hypothetical protein PHMEG_00012161 [Phytophthora megakarya]|uniref:Uncharacterized protein n=1 Tax=Phytophthora megakarya TaxID=4795 RepID=A0A225W9U7_9STRA|nr:hypothetical protein PHMEG_00012161 [Phytophthora megakarya]
MAANRRPTSLPPVRSICSSLLVPIRRHQRKDTICKHRAILDQPYLVISWGYSVGLHTGNKLSVCGMQKLSPPPVDQPVTTAILQRIRASCNYQDTHDCVLWGTAVVGFFFLLRRSECLAEGNVLNPTSPAASTSSSCPNTGPQHIRSRKRQPSLSFPVEANRIRQEKK